MEQQILNNIIGKYELQKKGLFAIAPVNQLIPNSFNHIFLTVCFGKILNFYIRIMAHGYCFSNRAFIFFLAWQYIFLPTLILYSSLSPFLLTLCPVPTSYFCQVFGVAIFSDGVNCFDITQQKNIDKNQNVKQTNCLFGS